jgi:hypothetical protein
VEEKQTTVGVPVAGTRKGGKSIQNKVNLINKL